MKKLSVLTTLLGAGVAFAFQGQVLAMDHGQMMDHGAMGAGDMAQAETSGAAQGQGVINSVDAAGRSVNITHDPIPALSWPGMTMDLPVTENVDLSGLSSGEKVDFKIVLGSDNVYRITEMGKAD